MDNIKRLIFSIVTIIALTAFFASLDARAQFFGDRQTRTNIIVPDSGNTVTISPSGSIDIPKADLNIQAGNLDVQGSQTLTGSFIAQSDVTIGVGVLSPDSLFDVFSTTKGARPFPTMTEGQRDAITPFLEALFVWNTDTKQLNVWDGSAWALVAGGGGEGGGLSEWTANAQYAANDTVFETGSNRILRAKTDFTSTGAFDFANWIILGNEVTPGDPNDMTVPSVDGNFKPTLISELSLLQNRSFETGSISPWTATGATLSIETIDVVQGEGSNALLISPDGAFSVSGSFNCDSYTGNTVGFEPWIKSDQRAEICYTQGGAKIDCIEYDGIGEYRRRLVSGSALSGSDCGIEISYQTPTAPILLDGVKFTTKPVDLAPSQIAEFAKFDQPAGYSSNNTKSPYFTNERINTFSSTGEMFNTSANGFYFKAKMKGIFHGVTLGVSNSASHGVSWVLNPTDAEKDTTPTAIDKNKVMIYSESCSSAGRCSNNTVNIPLSPGDEIYFLTDGDGVATDANITAHVSFVAFDTAGTSKADIVSSDAMTYKFKSTAIDCQNDAVGTYNTFVSQSSSTATSLCATAPTSPPNTFDGLFLTSVGWSSSGNCNTPNVYEVCVGNGFKGFKTEAYELAAKATPVDITTVDDNGQNRGVSQTYSDPNGKIRLDANTNFYSYNTRRFGLRGDGTGAVSSGYVHFALSKDPLVNTIKVGDTCVVEHHKSSGTGGGTCSTGSYFTYPITRAYGQCSFLKFDDSNDEITLEAGTYHIGGRAGNFRTSVFKHRLYDANNSELMAQATNSNGSGGDGDTGTHYNDIFTVGHSKTLEFQYRSALNSGANCLGSASGFGDDEIYGKFAIRKVK